MRKNIKTITIIIIIVVLVILVFYGLFYLLVLRNAMIIDQDPINSYQIRHLTLIFISSCATTLALIVALLKDEIRLLWRFSKLVITPKFPDFISEEFDVVSNEVDIRAEYYEVLLVVKNMGSLVAKECSIIITELQYQIVHDACIIVDVSVAEEVKWRGKNKEQILIPSNAGSSQVSVLKIQPNTSSTPGTAQSQPTTITIGNIDVTKNIPTTGQITWLATFMLFSETSKPIKYKLEIIWDGTWHHRKSEMLQHITIKTK